MTKNDKNISSDIKITGTEYQINPNDKIFDKYFIDNKNTIDNLDIINNNIQNNLTEEKIKININTNLNKTNTNTKNKENINASLSKANATTSKSMNKANIEDKKGS